MKIKYAFLGISFIIFILSCEPELTAEMIINKSLEEAHGGKENWETPTTLLYEKTTILYDSLGNIESQKKQQFQNTLQPEFTSKIIWIENGEEKRIVFDGKETFLFINGYQVTDDEKVASAHKEIMGAQFVLWQPYKLFTDEATLTNEGIVQLEDRTKAHSIKATYSGSDTIWWYYFDKKTFLLKENLIQHNKNRYSQIINIKQEEKTGLRLHKERKSFMVDTKKNQKYLRARYYYTILKLE